MADSPVTKKLQDMLNEEKWTRATLSGYTVNQMKELDALFEEAAVLKALDEVKSVCEEHLAHSKNSIGALYLSGLISLVRQQIDDFNMVSLLDIFADNKRWNIVEYICLRILDYGENRTALQRLAECYQNEDKVDAMYATWERLVKVDYEEADIVKLIAEKKEKDGEMEDAIDYYRKSLHRYVNKSLFGNAKEVWLKLVELSPEDIDFFFHVERKIAKQISEEKAANLLTDLYKFYKGKENWDTAIDILKRIIDYDEKNSAMRKEITECYKAKYAGHSHIEDYIRLSNLGQSYRNVHEAIADFEKHIAFDVGNFVYHRTWNIGRIKTIKGDDICIDFAKKRDHHMSLKMAIDSLVSLNKEHVWVLKAVWSRDKLYERIKNDIPWALKTLIKSFDNKADIKKIKAELVPSVLKASEWTGWSNQAREILKTDSMFGNAHDSVGVYIVRDRPLSLDEKIYNQFKAEKNFFPRVQCMRDFGEKCDVDSEYFSEMLSFFTSYVRPGAQVTEQVMAAYLLLKELMAKQPHLKNTVTMSFADLFRDCDDIIAVYEHFKDTKLKHALLAHVRSFVPEWADVYIRILPYALSEDMIRVLIENGHVDKLESMVVSIMENYRDNREAFIWIIKNLWNQPWVQGLGFPYDKILITLIHILDITYKEIENHRDTTENRRLNKQVDTILFKERKLETFLETADKDTIERIYTLIRDVKDLDPGMKLKLRKLIIEWQPDFKFNDEMEKTVISRGLMVTSHKFDEKKRTLAHIMEVDVPANTKEIAFALSLGDLRENAEYKAAKEKQDELNARVAKLKNEIERAQIMDLSTVNASKVGFGTEMLLHNDIDDVDETYIILGPWESDPTNHIISYLSPLGKRLLNHKVGDNLTFVIHDRKFQYTVSSIKAAKVQ